MKLGRPELRILGQFRVVTKCSSFYQDLSGSWRSAIRDCVDCSRAKHAPPVCYCTSVVVFVHTAGYHKQQHVFHGIILLGLAAFGVV